MCDQHLLHQLRCQPAITWLSNSLCVCEMKSRAPCIIVPSKTDEKNKTNEKIHLMSSGRQQFSNKSKFLCVTRMLRTTNESVVRYCLRHIQTVGIFPRSNANWNVHWRPINGTHTLFIVVDAEAEEVEKCASIDNLSSFQHVVATLKRISSAMHCMR